MKIWRVPFPKFGDGIGLHRTQAMAEMLGLDLADFGATGAVITGSNGKGSTAAMLASVLREADGPVGLFTSPHFFRLNERFQIDGEAISDQELALHWDRVEGVAKRWSADNGEAVGGFEFLFLIAADWFAARGCRFTVWEAGIGGRYDPVRLIRAGRTALVSLDYEHTALLGETLEEIAYDKLDAAPAGARAFLGEDCAPLRSRLETYCALRDITPLSPSPLAGEGRVGGNGGALFGESPARTPPPSPPARGGEEFNFVPPLHGPHQRNNTALAVALAHDMGVLDNSKIATGLAKTRWPGRLEIINTDPLIVIDAGHTPAGVRAALEGFQHLRGDRPAMLVCGASHDKNAAALIGALAPAFPYIICASARHKGAPAAEIAAAAANANSGAETVIADSVADARALVLAKARATGAAVYVAGGLFLAAEFKAVHLGLDPASLVFF